MIISNLNIYKIKNHHECAEQTLVCLYERRKDFNIYIYIYIILSIILAVATFIVLKYYISN